MEFIDNKNRNNNYSQKRRHVREVTPREIFDNSIDDDIIEEEIPGAIDEDEFQLREPVLVDEDGNEVDGNEFTSFMDEEEPEVVQPQVQTVYVKKPKPAPAPRVETKIVYIDDDEEPAPVEPQIQTIYVKKPKAPVAPRVETKIVYIDENNNILDEKPEIVTTPNGEKPAPVTPAVQVVPTPAPVVEVKPEPVVIKPEPIIEVAPAPVEPVVVPAPVVKTEPIVIKPEPVVEVAPAPVEPVAAPAPAQVVVKTEPVVVTPGPTPIIIKPEPIVIPAVEEPKVEEEQGIGQYEAVAISKEEKKKIRTITIISWVFIAIFVLLAVGAAVLYFLKVRSISIDYTKSASEIETQIDEAYSKVHPFLIGFIAAQAAAIFAAIIFFAVQSTIVADHITTEATGQAPAPKKEEKKAE